MGCVLVLCLPFNVKKSRWVRLLPGPPEAAEAHQDVVAGAGDVGGGLAEFIGSFPVLQDVRDGHGVVRGVGASSSVFGT